MKRFLLLVLCSIFAFPNTSSADVGSLIESLLQRFGADKVYSKHCVSDCNTLGYTVKASALGGRTDCVACPFDLECDSGKTVSTAQWYNCPTYSCADLGLLNKQPEGAECTKIIPAMKPGLKENCYICQCAEGSLNTMGCENRVALLKDSPATCAALGYRNSVTECENYIACPSDPNKVHCLADNCPAGQKGCSQLIELPDNSTGVTEEMTCCDGTTKSVVTNFTCNEGYTLSVDRKSCEATTCEANQYLGPDDAAKGATYNLEDCSQNLASGWKKVKVAANSTCYTCQCLLDNIDGQNVSDEARALLNKYPYTKTISTESLSDVACDGQHYKKCSCPANQKPKTIAGRDLFTVAEARSGYWVWNRPAEEEIIAEPKFSSCCVSATGEEHNYVSGFTCNAANGWVLTEDKTSCEASFCEGEKDDIFYSKNYITNARCGLAVARSGWTYTDGKSGGDHCGRCKCTTRNGKFTQRDSENNGMVEYGEPVCDGIHYNTCTLRPGVTDEYQKEADFLAAHPNIAPNSVATVKLCKEKYVRKTGTACAAGYTPDGQGGCQETECDENVYNISESTKYLLTAEAAENGHKIDFNECRSGIVARYELATCGPERTNYAVNADKTGCCQICNTDGGWTVALCGAGQKEDQTAITSTCDNRTQCHHCVDVEEGGE